MFVDLIAEQVDITIRDQRGQPIELCTADQRAAGVVRAVDDDHAGTRAQRIAQLLPVDGEVIQPQLHMDAAPTGQFDGGLVAVIARVENDHFVASANHAVDRAENRLRGTRRDSDFAVGLTVRP